MATAQTYDDAADRIEAQAAEIAAHREKISTWMMVNSLPTGHGDTLDDLLAEASAGIAALRAWDWVTGLLKWEEECLYLGPFRIATASIGFGIQIRTKDGLWRGLLETDPETDFVGGRGYATEAEARAAVETAVKEALWGKATVKESVTVAPITGGVNSLTLRGSGRHVIDVNMGVLGISEQVRTCETCAHEDVSDMEPPCARCVDDMRYPNWTPKITASKDGGK